MHTFPTAPGAEALMLDVDGEIVIVTIDGERQKLDLAADGTYTCVIKNPSQRVSQVQVVSNNNLAAPAQAFFRGPVKIKCGKGLLPLGNWSDQGALKFYSGGIKYSKTVDINPVAGARTYLDLGEVDATCEVRVNGSQPLVLVVPPY